MYTLYMHLHIRQLLGDCQTIFPNTYEQRQMTPPKTSLRMKKTATHIKRSMIPSICQQMRPIQGYDTEYTPERLPLLWDHIEDLARFYMNRVWLSPVGQYIKLDEQDAINDRLARQFELARLTCGSELFSQEHETIAASMIVASMKHYYNKGLQILPCNLYKLSNDICRDDISASTLSTCIAKINALKGILEENYCESASSSSSSHSQSQSQSRSRTASESRSKRQRTSVAYPN